jgi:hypothetical protein
MYFPKVPSGYSTLKPPSLSIGAARHSDLKPLPRTNEVIKTALWYFTISLGHSAAGYKSRPAACQRAM